MIAAALDTGIAASWVTGEEAYGQDPHLRIHLEEAGLGYILAVACSTRVRINQGRTSIRADTLADRLPEAAWRRHSAGSGAKGPRNYDRAWVHIGSASHHHLLIRRNRTTGELAFSPALVTHQGAPVRAGPRRPCPLEHRRMLPGSQGPGRTRPLPGQELDLMAPARHAGHACPGLPGSHSSRRGPQPARRSAPPRPHQ